MLCRDDFDKGPASLDEIEKGLWLGNLSAALDPETLRANAISYILTVDSSPLPDHVAQLNPIRNQYVNLVDIAKEDLLDHLDDCFSFIRKGLEAGENVLVHCFYGVSRSASVIIAFLMHKYRLDYEQAFDKVKAIRASIGPNPGFVQQLKLFKLMNWFIDTDHELYKAYRLRLASVNIQKHLGQPSDFANLVQEDPDQIPQSEATEQYRCRKCRRTLATDRNRLHHINHSSAGNPSCAYDEHNGLLADILVAKSSGDGQNPITCKHSFFVEPMIWMQNVTVESQGKLHCPKCTSKIGSFDWTTNGALCPCGALVAPSFYLVPSKVEIIRRFRRVPKL